MEVEIATIGGYEEVGRQMTAVRAGDDVVVFDMGLNLSKVLIHDNVETERMHSLDLIDMGAIPDDRVMSELEGDVKAIVPTHGHLDHIGAISKLAHRYDAPIVGTPFTIELVKQQIKGEEKFGVQNDLQKMSAGETMQIGERTELEFVNVTHSIIDAINPVLHTPEGAVVYGLDKRMDHAGPGRPHRHEAFPRDRTRGRRRPLLHRGLYQRRPEGPATPSESVARRHLKGRHDERRGLRRRHRRHDVLLTHRPWKSLVEFADDIGRQPVLLGRSMEKYSRHRGTTRLRRLPRRTWACTVTGSPSTGRSSGS